MLCATTWTGTTLRRATYFCLAFIPSTLVLAGGPYGSIEVWNWTGGAYTNDATGQFSHCAAHTQYQSGIGFVVGINVNGGWSLGFGHDSWRLNPGEKFPIDLTFDSGSQFHVFGVVHSPNAVVVTMPLNSDLSNRFQMSQTMAAFAKGQLIQFDLTSTSQLLPALATCVAQALVGSPSAVNIRIPGSAAPPLRPR